MRTTSLIVELVIIGFQVLIWIYLLIGIFFTYNWITFDNLKAWAPLLTFTIIVVSYPLGLIFDNFAAKLLTPIGRKVKSNLLKDLHLGHLNDSEMVIALKSKDPAGYKKLEKVGDQSRLIRATIINLSLISILIIFYVVFRTHLARNIIIFICFFICLLSIIFIYLAKKAWEYYLKRYLYTLKQLYDSNFSKDKNL